MSSSDVAISVRGLGKCYQIVHNTTNASTMAEALATWVRQPFKQAERESFWALKNVSFEIKQGEVVGIVGRNGAGKSTLLKTLSRITEPTEGEIDLYGRVGSLLEVGTGFHPELTGRENIYLNGGILGMSRSEIRSQFDAIVDFSEVERFLDTPVKRYSSGMYVRLAFAVAAHLRSEILIIDEVLAVGDATFQAKCLNKMRDATTQGRTVLFVSHNMSSVAELCDSAILLVGGQLQMHGDTAEIIKHYFEAPSGKTTPIQHRRGSGEIRFQYVSPSKDIFDPAEEKVLNFKLQQFKPATQTPFIVFEIYDESSSVVARCDTRLLNWYVRDENHLHGSIRLRSPWFKPGRYRVRVELDNGTQFVDVDEDACWVTVGGALPYQIAASEDTIRRGPVLSDFSLEEGDVSR
jgi:lipopolysaccharide transport system ATP-binding protein